jgi:hypothetical protein
VGPHSKKGLERVQPSCSQAFRTSHLPHHPPSHTKWTSRHAKRRAPRPATNRGGQVARWPGGQGKLVVLLLTVQQHRRACVGYYLPRARPRANESWGGY